VSPSGLFIYPSIDGVVIRDNNYHVINWSDTMITERRQNTASSSVPGHRTIAQSIRWCRDPHRAAITSFTRRDCPHGQNKHTYYFEDGSFLTFEVSYLAVEDGGR
jgi:hypothetical protein